MFVRFARGRSAGAEFIQNEDAYKRSAATRAHARLEPYLRDTRKISTDAEARKLGNDLFELTNFFNWRDRSYINDELLSESDGGWLAFMQMMLICLEKTPGGNWQAELRTILEWLKKKGCPANISKMLPVYFLFLWDPANHFFLKASILDRFLLSIEEPKLGKGMKLTVENYEAVLTAVRKLRDALGDWKPRDNIDVQSFAYLVDRAQSEPTISKPTIDDSAYVQSKSKSEVRPKLPLNLILAGPPGTGKTYRLMKILCPLFEEHVVAQSKDEFIRDLGSTLTWKDTAAIALELLGGKAKVPELAKNGSQCPA